MNDEINHKKVSPITVGLIIVIGAIGVEIGMLINAQAFAFEEVQGLRNDMDKEDKKHLERIEKLEQWMMEHIKGK
jgi:hypothetical protein